MSDHDHLRIEDYVSASRRPDGPAVIARHTQHHMVEVCPDCSNEWSRLGDLRSTYLDRLRNLPGPAPPPPVRDGLLATSAPREDHARLSARLRRHHKNVLNELSDLRRTPPAERLALIRRAHRRFRSPLLAQLLIEECRQRVRNAPAEAEDLVALVPEILGWTLEARPVPPWGPHLLARAAAHRANALRVAGELPAAERAFAHLRRRLGDHPLGAPEVIAEIDSLEASLCIDQRRFEEAEGLLHRAAMDFQSTGSAEGLLRTRVQQANLLHAMARPADVLRLLDFDESQFDSQTHPHLHLCAATARANALCDLERFDEADVLLTAHLDDYEASEDPFAGALYRILQGRVALGQGRIDDAEEAFRASRDGLLTLGRAYDAALTTLFLSEALLAGGKTRELRQLARGLVSAFASRGVEGETLAALDLLARAVAAERLTSKLLADLRRRLAAPGRLPLTVG